MTRDDKLKLIYRHTHKDFKGRLNGSPSILVLVPNIGTCLVLVADLTDEQIADKLPYAMSRESARLAKKAEVME